MKNLNTYGRMAVLFLAAAIVTVCLAMLFVGTGCTVKPVETEARQASFDGTNQNSGFIGWTKDGSGIITPHARDRYNGLVAIYGKRFDPPLTNDQGIYYLPTKDGNYLICQSALVNFQTMNRWRVERK